jgi:hypothetical protein
VRIFRLLALRWQLWRVSRAYARLKIMHRLVAPKDGVWRGQDAEWMPCAYSRLEDEESRLRRMREVLAAKIECERRL